LIASLFLLAASSSAFFAVSKSFLVFSTLVNFSFVLLSFEFESYHATVLAVVLPVKVTNDKICNSLFIIFIPTYI